MDDFGLLALFAQVAVTLTGFAGLMTAFRSRRGASAPVEKASVRVMLLCSASATLFALLPLPFLMETDRAGLIWTVASPLLALYLLLLLPGAWLWTRRLGIRPRRPLVFGLLLAGTAAIALALLLAAAGFLPIEGAPAYSLGLLWLLAIAMLQFLVQIFATLELGD